MIQARLAQIMASSYNKIPRKILEEFFGFTIYDDYSVNISDTKRLAEFLKKYPQYTEAMLDAVIDIAYREGVG